MYQIEKLNQIKGFKHFISTIADGNMSIIYDDEETVYKNRKNFLDKCNIKEQEIAYMYSKEVHNNFIKVDKNSEKLGIIEPYGFEADSIIINDPNIAIMLIVADCVPMFLYDPTNHVIGLAHCGIKWTDNGTAKKTIQKMKQLYNTDPQTLIIGLGPSIQAKSVRYEFWNPINSHYWKDCVSTDKNGKYMVDNVKATINQLIGEGVNKKNIFKSDIDTYTDKRFYSHTRSRDTGEKEGRFTVVIKLSEK